MELITYTVPITSEDDENGNNIPNQESKRVLAGVLGILLGVFGVHRLYLGTKSIVPITYTLTLGGGMAILPIVDVFYIISEKDINQLTNNEFVFMWNKKVVSKPVDNKISTSN